MSLSAAARSRASVGCVPLELIGEWLIVEENPWVAKLPVESVLHLLYTGDHAIQVFIPTEEHEGGVGACVGG